MYWFVMRRTLGLSPEEIDDAVSEAKAICQAFLDDRSSFVRKGPKGARESVTLGGEAAALLRFIDDRLTHGLVLRLEVGSEAAGHKRTGFRGWLDKGEGREAVSGIPSGTGSAVWAIQVKDSGGRLLEPRRRSPYPIRGPWGLIARVPGSAPPFVSGDLADVYAFDKPEVYGVRAAYVRVELDSGSRISQGPPRARILTYIKTPWQEMKIPTGEPGNTVEKADQQE